MKAKRSFSKPRKLAIFDIDGTIFRSGLFIELFHEIVKQGTFKKSVLKEVEKEYLAWINRRGHYMTYGLKLASLFDRDIKGKKEADIKRAARRVVLEQKDKVYVFTRQLLQKLKKEKYFLLAISGSPYAVVKEFTGHYGFDRFFSTEHEVKNGVFTGRVGGIKLQKANAVNLFLEEFGEFDYKSSVGVGDTESDIVFLEKVAKPIAFNPSIELMKHAKKKGWRIVVERKDVIYDIKEFKTLS
jgi:HAD superfamily hydrolase (TIGR01490 family)